MNLEKVDVVWLGQNGNRTMGVVLSKDKTMGYYVAHIGLAGHIDSDVDIEMIQRYATKLTMAQAYGFFGQSVLDLDANYN